MMIAMMLAAAVSLEWGYADRNDVVDDFRNFRLKQLDLEMILGVGVESDY